MARVTLKKVCLNCWQSYQDPAETACRLSCGWVLMRVPASFKSPADGRAKAKATAEAKKTVLCCPTVGCPVLRVYPQVESPGSGSQKKRETPQCFTCRAVAEGASIYLWLDKVGDPDLKDLAAFASDSRMLWRKAETAALLGLNEHDALNLLQQAIEEKAGAPFGVLKEWVRESVEPFVESGTVNDRARREALDKARGLGLDAALAGAVFDELAPNPAEAARHEQPEDSSGEDGDRPDARAGEDAATPQTEKATPAASDAPPSETVAPTKQPHTSVESPTAVVGEFDRGVEAEEPDRDAEGVELSITSVGEQSALKEGGEREGRGVNLRFLEAAGNYQTPWESLKSRVVSTGGALKVVVGGWMNKPDPLQKPPWQKPVNLLLFGLAILSFVGVNLYSVYGRWSNKTPVLTSISSRSGEIEVDQILAKKLLTVEADYKDDQSDDKLDFRWDVKPDGVKGVENKRKLELDLSAFKKYDTPFKLNISLTIRDPWGWESALLKKQVWVIPNRPPSIVYSSKSASDVVSGTDVLLTVKATDDDGDNVTYRWHSIPNVTFDYFIEDKSQAWMKTAGLNETGTSNLDVEIYVYADDNTVESLPEKHKVVVKPPEPALTTVPTPTPTPPPTVSPIQIGCWDVDKEKTHRIGETVKLFAKALHTQGGDLHYVWRTQAGRLSPNDDEKAVLYTDGINATTKKFKVRVTAYSDSGPSASCYLDIKVEPPSPPPPPTPEPTPRPTPTQEVKPEARPKADGGAAIGGKPASSRR